MGKLLYQSVRYQPKNFKQRAPKSEGGWTWSVTNVRKVPYRLSELLAADLSFVCHTIRRIGKAAGVKVATDPRAGKVKYASAHDCRRAFAERWSTRVTPQVLMALMRHESIETTMRYYVGRNANTAADAAWEAYRRSQEGTVLGTVAQRPPATEVDGTDITLGPIGA